MKRYISADDRSSYTCMLEILLAVSEKAFNYKWLITDIVAYSMETGNMMNCLEIMTF